LIQFGPTEVEDYDEALSRIQQEGTWQEYQQEFEQLANQADGWPQKTLMGTFLGGLKKDIVSAVRMFKPKTLRDAIELARMRDDNLSRDPKTARGEGPKPQQTESFPKHNHSTMSTYSAEYQQILHAHIHLVLPRNCRGRRRRKEGRKACVSVAMKSSHRDIVAKHLKHSLLGFCNGGKV
jgi:hypothetical protein